MNVRYTPLKVGKRGLEDKVQIELPGTLIKPDSRSDILLLVEAGFFGHHEAYIDFFGKKLGNEFNIYLSQIRDRGVRSVKHSLDDLFQIDLQLRDLVETDRVVYIGHSMGANIVMASIEKHNTQVKGIYAICAYPSYGDTRTRNENPDKKSLQQRGLDMLSVLAIDHLTKIPTKKLPVGLINKIYRLEIDEFAAIPVAPLKYQIKKANIDEVVRFAICGNDELVNTRYPEIAERFKTMFTGRFKNSTVEVFPDRNHCFNFAYKDMAQFNKDDPEPLVYDVTKFVYENASK